MDSAGWPRVAATWALQAEQEIGVGRLGTSEPEGELVTGTLGQTLFTDVLPGRDGTQAESVGSPRFESHQDIPRTSNVPP